MFRLTSNVMLTACASICVGLALAAEPPTEPPAGPGLDLIQQSCVGCHDIYMITGKRKTPEGWAETLELMAARGAEVTPDEMRIIEEYLTRNFAVSAAESARANDN